MSSEFDVDSGDLSAEPRSVQRETHAAQRMRNGPNWLRQLAATDLRTTIRYSQLLLLVFAVFAGIVVGTIVLWNALGESSQGVANRDDIPPVNGKPALPVAADPSPEEVNESYVKGKEVIEPAPYDPKLGEQDHSDREPSPYEPVYAVETAEETLIASLYWKGKQFDELLTEAKEKLADWSQLAKNLETNEAGRRIAGSKILTEQFVAICDRHQDEQRDVDKLVNSFGVSFQSVTYAAHNKHSEFSPTDLFIAEFDSLGETIKQKLNSLRVDFRAVEALIRAAEETTPGEKTLQEAVDEIRKKHSDDRKNLIAAEMLRVREAANHEIAIAEAAKVKAERDFEVQRIRDEEAAISAKTKELEIAAAHNAKAREQALKEAELERQFDAAFPRMRTYLTPFITDGYAQPGSGDQFTRTVKKGPVSFGKLKGSGILDESIEGLRRFNAMVSAYSHANDRDLGGFPPYGGGAQDFAAKQERLMMVQGFLNQYGAVMVKKGLLAP